MDNKIIGRFEPIGDDKGLKRSAFDVLTKEDAECLGGSCKRGYTGVDAYGLKYSAIHEYWQWVPALPQPATVSDERTKACDAMFGVLLKMPEEMKANRSDIVEALYDAGYRKFEIVDEPSFGHSALSTSGLTMRDYFACSILPGVFSNETALERFRTASAAEGFPIASLIATAAYGIADAMLAERAK